MNDRYLAFANSGAGHWLTGKLGLPQPEPLRREPGRLSRGAIVGTGARGRMGAAIGEALHSLGIPARPTEKPDALLFDATGIARAEDSQALHAFFHANIRSLQAQGRILVFATPPEEADGIEAAAIQRGIDAFVRSLAKESRKAATVQTLYVSKGAEGAIASTLAFFLSDRSGYVSGQPVHLRQPVAATPTASARTVVVTGASRGIGLAIAESFAAAGERLVLVDVPALEAELAGVAARLGGDGLALDVTAADAGARLVADARTRGGYDVVVHNAGITRDRTIARMDAARWNQVMAVNLSAPIRTTQELLDAGAIKAGGRIVGIASLSGIAGNKGQTNYALSKAGMIGWIEQLANVIGSQGLTANAVAPGFIETKMTAAIPFAIREAGRRMNSLGQGGQPIDVAETVVWLADRGSGAINGETVRVCGQSVLGA